MNEQQPRNFNEDFNNAKKINWKPIIFKLFGINKLQDYEDNKIIQLELGMDKAVVTNKGRRYSIELKSRRSEYFGFPNWLLEIVHQRYTDQTKTTHLGNIPGWLYTTTADIIIYGTIGNNGEIIEYVAFTPTPFKNEEFKKEITPSKMDGQIPILKMEHTN
jgi:hypothetical protein